MPPSPASRIGWPRHRYGRPPWRLALQTQSRQGVTTIQPVASSPITALVRLAASLTTAALLMAAVASDAGAEGTVAILNGDPIEVELAAGQSVNLVAWLVTTGFAGGDQMTRITMAAGPGQSP